MFEIHEMLRESAEALAIAGGFFGTAISLILYAFDIWYLMNLISIPFYLRDIAKGVNKRR